MSRPARAQEHSRETVTGMSREQQITEAFVSLSDITADDVDPFVLLRRLTVHSVQLTGMDAAGVMLVNARGRLRPVARTTDSVEVTEMFQGQIEQGPCVDAYFTGDPVHADDLIAQGDRWPDFTPLAVAAGFRAAHALPLRVRHQQVGALNLLAHEPTGLPPGEARLLQALADTATAAVVTWRADPLRPSDIVTRTQSALSGKALLDTAAGMIAATAGIAPGDAAGHLIGYAETRGERPTDVAAQIVRNALVPRAVLPPEN
ncbi:GAF and ANTAR domain-containing protein [Streptomyces sp. NPDC051742]|uniref:GAF and ANTAR domain-containing protein n=1 Tax=unclassified Streptomyces TaxID=2593676 RepID=UPI00342411A6